MSKPSNVIKFLHIIENLKRTKRTGWVDNGIKGPESIADHMHRMAVMAMLFDNKSLDTSKCVKMAIVHDLAESVVGDITPHMNVSKTEKHKLELDAIESFRTLLGDTPQSREIRNLWQEYEDASTPEALLVKDLDKFEMLVQAVEYEK
ncbi:HD domain-containing protein 2, partial [Jimgerdemannia flammicorona]